MDHTMLEEIKGFVDEINDQLPDIESTILNLGSENGTEEDLNTIFRFFHNIKGTSAMFELDLLQEVFHVAESFLDAYRVKKTLPDSNSVDLILDAIDEYKKVTKHILEKRCEPAEKPYQFLAKIMDTIKIVGDSETAVREVSSAGKFEMEQGKDESGESVRLSTDQLERLCETVSSFFYLQNGLMDALGNELHHKELKTDIKNFSENLQDLLLSVRLAPLKPLLQGMQRVVKTTAKQVKKEINFRIIGDEVGLDRKILELVREPLIHIIRNSIDHGIEDKETRIEANKNPEGSLIIETVQNASTVVINITDDGKGLDREAILNKAIEKGIIEVDQKTELADREIFDLIFHPGFSTKQEASTISGRGVGMDSVKTVIESCEGHIEVKSTKGLGTKMSLILPLSLAVVKTISFYVGDQLFAISQEYIDEVYSKKVLRETGRLKTMEDGSVVFKKTGFNVPVIKLSDLFDLGESIVMEEGSLVVVKHGDNMVGIDVGEMFKPMNFIAHSLPHLLANNDYISGINQLNNGEYIALINVLAIMKLTDYVVTIDRSKSKKAYGMDKTVSDFFRSKQKVVAFSYGGKNFALPVQTVKEVFQIERSQHQFVKENVEYIVYQGKSYPLIQLEKHFAAEKPTYSDVNTAILLSYQGIDAVILCESFHGVPGLPPEFEANMKTKGLLGVINFDDESYLTLNVHEVFAMEFPANFEDYEFENTIQSRILVVEDDSFFMKAICSFFDSYGLKYLQAFNGQEAIDIITQHQKSSINISYIVTDYEMPVLDGLEFLRWIKAHKGYKAIPTMMLTAVGDNQTKMAAKELGVSHFVNKMNYTTGLEKVVNKVIERQRTGLVAVDQDELTPALENNEKLSFNRLLTFRVGKQLFGVHINSIKEYATPSATTDIPLSPEYLKEIVAFRGTPIPLLDLRKICYSRKLGEARDICSELVAKLPSGELCALWVDEVHQVYNMQQLTPAIGIERKKLSTGLSSLLSNVYLSDDETIAVIDMKKLELFIQLVFKKHHEKAVELDNDEWLGKCG